MFSILPSRRSAGPRMSLQTFLCSWVVRCVDFLFRAIDLLIYGLLICFLAYSGAQDFVLALLPWTLVWNLQMKKKEKIGIAFAMSLGVL